MNTFKRWLESQFDNPRTNVKYGVDPLASACQKLTIGIGKEGKLTNGYTGPSVLANIFGLSQEELQVAMQRGIVKNGDVNVAKLQQFQKLLNAGQSANLNYQTPQMPPLPPVPQKKVI